MRDEVELQVLHATPEDSTLDVQLAVSRDSIHSTRVGDRSTFLSLGPIGSWDRFNLSLGLLLSGEALHPLEEVVGDFNGRLHDMATHTRTTGCHTTRRFPRRESTSIDISAAAEWCADWPATGESCSPDQLVIA